MNIAFAVLLFWLESASEELSIVSPSSQEFNDIPATKRGAGLALGGIKVRYDQYSHHLLASMEQYPIKEPMACYLLSSSWSRRI